MTTRAATYSRKSTTDQRNPGKSVADQAREARDEVERRGWTLVKECADDGISASRHARGKVRPGFDELLHLIEAGEVDAVVMAEQSRVTRSLAVLGALLQTCADRNVTLVVGGSDVDPAKPEGFLLAGVTGAVDAAESERTRQRVLRGKRGSAMDGKPHGRNQYGYSRRYDPQTGALLAVEPDENAPIVVEIIDRLASGESIRSVTASLNARGIPAPKSGGQWGHSTVRRIALSPGYAALRVHQGKVVGKADWPALVSEDRHRAVVARLTDPSRVKHRPAKTKHLLSGTAVCSECGGPLRARTERHGRMVYACRRQGCQKVSIHYVELEEYVTEVVLARLERPAVVEAIAAAHGTDFEAARDAVEALQARRKAIGEAMAAGLDLLAAQTALETLAGQISEAEARLRAATKDPLLADVVGGDVRARWEALTGEQRHALVRLVVGVTVSRSTRPRGSRGFDPDRVSFSWRM